MAIQKLSDFQLFSLIQSRHLTPSQREAAEAEFGRRGLSEEEISAMAERYNQAFAERKEEGLGLNDKLLLILLPFSIFLKGDTRNLPPEKLAAYRNRRQFYCIIGFSVWLILLLYFLSRN